MSMQFRSQSVARQLLSFVGLNVVCLLAARGVEGGPARIGLTAGAANSRIITGGSTDITAFVQNTAGTGSTVLNYSATFKYPYGNQVFTGTRFADGGADADMVVGTYNSAGQPLGVAQTIIDVSDPNASNDPQSAAVNVKVLDHADPFIRFPGVTTTNLETQQPIIQTQQDTNPEQQAAGNEIIIATPNVFGDPPAEAAGLDLDSITSTGDPQITTDLAPFKNLPSTDDPTTGDFFHIYVDVSHAGTFSKTFYLDFSDEDLPGANAPGSVHTQFTVINTVHLVPEPASAGTLVLGAAGLLAFRRRRRQSR
jgi:hypothetical protein